MTNMLQQAVTLHQSGRLAEAAALYQQILQSHPRHFDALHLLGVIYFQSGHNQPAVELIGQAIAINPAHPAPYLNIGLALKALGRAAEALAHYDKAIALKPNYPDAFNNRAAALQELQRTQEALDSYDRAVALDPGFVEAWNNRGTVLRDLKRPDDALASYDRALALKPDFAAVWSNRGAVLHDLKRADEALASYEKALALEPNYPDAWNNRGVLLRDLQRPDDALACFDRAIAIQPDYVEAYVNRAPALRDLKRLTEAADSYAQALALKPDYEFLSGYWLETRVMACDWNGLDKAIADCAAGIRQGRKMITPFPLLAMMDDPALHHRSARIYTDAKCPGHSALGPLPPRPPGPKIRIGYYSADFHNHATTQLIAEALESHDRSRFELHGFSFGPDDQDAMRRRIAAAFDSFTDVRGLSDVEIAQRSRELGIDIAVDLKGHTQHSRPGIFAGRAAPLQAQWIGYPGTMGADYMDYVIADGTVIPAGSESDYSEKILRLPHSYQANDSKRAISGKAITWQEAGLPPSGFVFCSFNNNYKILPQAFESWMRILTAVHGSVLWLLEDNETAAANLRKETAARGVDPARLVFAGRVPLDEHLARHRLADLFLDTWPYNAHTTASDALWTGLPLLTCAGHAFAGRVAASLLNALALPELLTNTVEDYEARAIDLAQNPESLAAIRNKLESNRTTMPLFDGKLFARHLEAGYEAIFARHQSGLPPDHIQVSP
jgi:predicted O-linked N-acetylglucosamine transferase (SPINDLY family)